MKLGSNIAVNNVLQVYVTTTMIFYAKLSQKMRTSYAQKQEYGSSDVESVANISVDVIHSLHNVEMCHAPLTHHLAPVLSVAAW